MNAALFLLLFRAAESGAPIVTPSQSGYAIALAQVSNGGIASPLIVAGCVDAASVFAGGGISQSQVVQ